jgi:hypothetical protein
MRVLGRWGLATLPFTAPSFWSLACFANDNQGLNAKGRAPLSLSFFFTAFSALAQSSEMNRGKGDKAAFMFCTRLKTRNSQSWEFLL